MEDLVRMSGVHTLSYGMSLRAYFSLICFQVFSCLGMKLARGIFRGGAVSMPNHSASAGHSCRDSVL